MSSQGQRTVRLVDTPCFGRPVELWWRKRAWRCDERGCGAGLLTEQNDTIAPPRALLTGKACWWAIRQLRPARQHRRFGPPARHKLANPMEGHQAAAGDDGR